MLTKRFLAKSGAVAIIGLVIGYSIGGYFKDLFTVFTPVNSTATGDFDAVWRIAVDNFVREIPDTEEAKRECFQKTLEGSFAYCLGDPHSKYLSPATYKEFQIENSGSYVGIGLNLTEKDGITSVIEIADGAPAAESGMFQIGDMIAEINGEGVIGKPLVDVVSMLKGGEGTSVAVRVGRNGVLLEPVTLVRQKVIRRTVEIYLLNDSVAIVKISEFSESTQLDLLGGLSVLHDNYNIDKFVLELRDNLGGLREEVQNISLLFARSANDIILTLKHRSEKEIKFTVGDVFAKNSPFASWKPGQLSQASVVVLVNGRTASAAEILAGLLRDWLHAPIVGEKTYGKGTVQSMFPLSDDSRLKLTTYKYSIGNGMTEVDGIGITPDYIVEGPSRSEFDPSKPKPPAVDLEHDEQLRTAIGVLLSMEQNLSQGPLTHGGR